MDIPSPSLVSLPSFVEPFPSTGSKSIRLFSKLGDPSSSSTSHISEAARKIRKNVHAQGKGKSDRHAKTINILPDNVLLEIFVFWPNLAYKWHLLGHVCQRWRQILFASPLRLNLRIRCTQGRVRRDLAIWPAFPLIIHHGPDRSRGDGNVFVALEHPNRVWDVDLYVSCEKLRKMAALMQEPFPVLTHLHITVVSGGVVSIAGIAPVLPVQFLGGSAPRLQSITLSGVPYPTIPTLLLSSSDLVTLRLLRIPPTGYISPEAMVTCLAVLPRIKDFYMEFQSAFPRPDRIHLPPITRTVLPALTSFEFYGASEYLENLVAHIDSPQLRWIWVVLFNQLVDFQAAQLSKFIDRSIGPVFKHAEVTFSSDKATFAMYPRASHPRPVYPRASITIRCEGIDCQVSHLAQALSQFKFSVTLFNVVHLNLEHKLEKGRQLEGTDDVEWQHFLCQFSTVKTLHVSRQLAGHVALALEDIEGGMAAEVLPSLDLTWLAGRRIKKFVAARRLSGRPVTVISIKKEFNQRLESYVG